MQVRAPTISIRSATNKDAPGILACLHDAFEEFRETYTPDAFLDTVLTAKTLKERLKTMSVFVAANSDDEVVGTIACALVTAAEGHLRGMAVLPSNRGSGIASQLLNRAESELLKKNVKRITLDTTEPLGQAMHFYEKHGYRRTGRVSDFFGMPLIEYHKGLPSR